MKFTSAKAPECSFSSTFQIRWRSVFWGLGLQFALAIAVLRWKPGYSAIKFLTKELNKFLGYSFAGAALAFGDPFFFLHPFAMMVNEYL